MMTPTIWNVVALSIGLLLGALIAWLFARTKSQQETETLKIQIAELQKDREAGAEKIQWVERAEAQMREALESLASRSLQTNADDLSKRVQAELEGLLNQTKSDWQTQKVEIKGLVDPLQTNLSTLDEHVRELEEKREGAYQSISEQIRNLSQTSSDLKEKTITLVQALKSSPSVRGRWGEMQLRRVAEMSGMIKHITFKEQFSTDDGRPDMIVYLPNGGIIPVDAKTSLEKYLEILEISDSELRKTRTREVVSDVRSRVRELSRKKYWEQFDHAPDFVIMFVAVESCLGMAFESDAELMEYAAKRRVMIATPVTLLALLKAVAYGWQQYQLTENARHIAEQARELYERFSIFIGYLAELQSALSKSVEAYNSAIGSLEHRLLPMVRHFEESGAATTELKIPEEIDAKVRSVSEVGGS